MTHRTMTREEALPLVQRLIDGDYTDEAEGNTLLEALERGLACPHIGGYIFWDLDPELTAAKVVDKALAYQPIAL
ncbi:e9imm peptide [Streptomyces atacamensis]|jgi:hypothetical protein|uniref:e9imm peptide n=1 Tax=Streptomyces atacamensis TaxID=531966 RepID=UPI00399CB99A